MSETESYTIPGAKVLLMGDSGTGKTHTLRTLIDAGIKPFIIFTEPGMELLSDLPADKVHWKYIPPVVEGWQGLVGIAQKTNSMDSKTLVNLKDPQRQAYNQFIKVLETCNDFVCDRTGESFGDVGNWQTDRALVFDSMTGLNKMVSKLVIGGRPIAQMAEWQLMQNNMRGFIDKITTGLQCFVIVTAHQDREKDEITGGTSIMVKSLGAKLAPEIPLFFSDVIQTIRVGDEFSWSTAGANVSVKARNVPISSKIPPSFAPLIEKWKARGGKVQETPVSNSQQ